MARACLFYLALVLGMGGGFSLMAAEQKNDGQALPARAIFGKLDLTRPGLEKVRAALDAKDEKRAAQALLAYYRARTSVKFSVDPAQRAQRRGRAASSGDLKTARGALKNILISQPSYPPHDFGKEIHWKRNPYPDKEWIWQLHRMYWWGPLGKAYWHTGNEQFARTWAKQFLDWRRKTPPGFHDGWRTLEMGIRGFAFCSWYHYFRDSEAFTPKVLLELLATLWDHAVRLAPKYRSKSNWGLMESEGLAHIAMVFPEFKQAAKWRETALKRLAVELDKQVYPDGMQRELSFGYHGGCISWFSRTADLCKINGLAMPKDYRKKVEKMYHVLGYALKPDGTIPMFGDAWNSPALRIVEQGAKRYGRPDLAYIASLDKKKHRGKKPERTSAAFLDSGYYIFRSDWSPGAIWMALKCGPDGGGHCQPDNGSFELFAHGSYLMPDSGCFIYSGDEKNRAWFKATAHHPCLTLDGRNSAYRPKLLLWQTGPELTALSVENRSYPKLAHRRSVFFVLRKFFVIVDEALGSAEGERRLHFQFGPPKALLKDGGAIVLKGRGAGRLLFQPFHGNTRAKAELGQVAFQYRQKEPRSAFSYRLNTQPVFAALLAPYQGPTAPACSARVLAAPDGTPYRPGQARLQVELTWNGRTYRLERDLKAGKAVLKPLAKR